MTVNNFLAVQKNMVSIIRIIEILFDRYCSSNRQVDGLFLKSSLLLTVHFEYHKIVVLLSHLCHLGNRFFLYLTFIATNKMLFQNKYIFPNEKILSFFQSNWALSFSINLSQGLVCHSFRLGS